MGKMAAVILLTTLVAGCGGGREVAPDGPPRVADLCPGETSAYQQGGGVRTELPADFEIVAVTWCSRPLPEGNLVERFTTEPAPLTDLIESFPDTPPPTETRDGALLACDSQPGNREIVYLYPAEGDPILWDVPADTSCGYSRDRHDVFEVLENDVTWTWQGDPVTLE
ncbi:hypothetical protein [Parenemella sanctibonifatiensis]|uniref:hypothetical protein n=1 Tax=Parenemella sanctibonifatiensis TaxID=2016505 RepID=UPI001185C4A2|nr:hypothetical protein [Parenemella sanctibonifatiensis]